MLNVHTVWSEEQYQALRQLTLNWDEEYRKRYPEDTKDDADNGGTEREPFFRV